MTQEIEKIILNKKQCGIGKILRQKGIAMSSLRKIVAMLLCICILTFYCSNVIVYADSNGTEPVQAGTEETGIANNEDVDKSEEPIENGTESIPDGTESTEYKNEVFENETKPIEDDTVDKEDRKENTADNSPEGNQAIEEESISQEGYRANSWRYQNGSMIVGNARSIPSSNAWNKVNGVYVNNNGDPIPGAVKKGIDVSYAQGRIDWEKVKADGIDFAIIQCGYGNNYASQDDKYWAYNVSECERLGIPYGVYIYSYATSVKMAKSEAEHVLRLIKGRSFSYPVYLDMEDEKTVNLSSKLKGEIAQVFCDTITASGYKVGIYANLDWWNIHLTSSVFKNPKWSKWVAQHNSTCDYVGKYDIWQCTSTGKVNGIEGYVDINFWMDYSLPYKDVSVGDWFYDAAFYMYENGYMTGLSTDRFGPSAQISRAQFTTILYRMSGSPDIAYSPVFPDVPNGQFYTKAVLWANKAGVVTGYKSTGNFGPSDLITREQMATILYRYAKYKGYDTSQRGSLNQFSDGDKVAPFALDAMRWAVGVGIISGNANGSLAPRNPADRAAAAVMMMRFETILGY